MTRKIGLAFLIAMGLFLVVGNFGRILPFAAAMGSANAGELLLYAFGFSCSFLVVNMLLRCRLFLILLTGVILSLLVGLAKWGVDTTAVLYNVRLILQIVSAAVAGAYLYKYYGDNVVRFIDAFFVLYAIIVVLSYMIFYFFPDAGFLLAALADEGVEFSGDPHLGRLVSMYLDPNYFSIIIVLPIVLALGQFFRKPSVLIGLFIVLLLLALVLTVSRSGSSLLLLIGGVLFLGWAARTLFSLSMRSFRVKTASVYVGVVFLFLFSVMIVLIGPTLLRLSERFTSVASDDSALERLTSFQIGMDLIDKEPILGFGYNFSLKPILAVRGIGLPGLDSSLQGVIVNFGLLPSICLIFAVLFWWIKVNSTLKSYGSRSDVVSVWRLVTTYIVLCILWAANFNPVLLYPFWLVPVLTILMYFEFIAFGRRRPVTKPVSFSSVHI